MSVMVAGPTGVLALSIVLLLFLEAPASGQSDKRYTLDQVRGAWKTRQDAVKVLRAAVATRTTMPKGAYTGLFRRPDTKGNPIIPEADAVHLGESELVVDGKKMRVASSGACWDGDGAAFTPFRRNSAFDGERYVSRMELGRGPPSAVGRSANRNQDVGDATLYPIIASVRGVDPALMGKINLEHYVHLRQVNIGKRSLIELTRPRTETMGEGRIWVDPLQDMALERFESRDRDGNLSERIVAVQSQPTGSQAWLPERWTVSLHDPGNKLFRQVEATAKYLEINGKVPPSEFQIDLPPGTRFSEPVGDKSQHSIIRGDGSKRVIAPSEWPLSYDELLHTDGEDGRVLGARAWWMVGLGACLAVASLLLIARARSVRRSGNSTDATPTE